MSALAAALPAGTFGAAHILLTAGITAVLTLVAVVLLKVRGGVDLAVLTVLAFTATWLLRTAATCRNSTTMACLATPRTTAWHQWSPGSSLPSTSTCGALPPG